MRKIALLFALILASAFASFQTTPASAQATRTWVSGVGDDVNPCSRTAPCKTFPGAISKTAAGGEIDCLDPGGFGAVTVTKAITIACEFMGEGGILVAGTNGVTVNAGANDVVILRGLIIDGGPIGSNSLAGVKFIAGRMLEIQNSVIRNFTGGSPNGYGVSFTPATSASLFISDTVVTTNGPHGSGTGGGIFIQPSGGGVVQASFTRVNVVNNEFGIRADGSLSTGSIFVTVDDSLVSHNSFAGFAAFTPVGGALVQMMINRSTSSLNGFGLNSNGAGATLRIGNSIVSGNATGIKIQNGGTMTSFGNNQIFDNVISGPSVPIVTAN